MTSNMQVALRSALAAVVCLGLPSGMTFWRAILLRTWPQGVGYLAASLLPDERSGLWAPLFVGGAALWGIALSRITQGGRAWRMALASALAVFVGTSFAFSLMGRESSGLPAHHQFALIFLLTGFANSTAIAIAMGLVWHSWRMAFRLALGVGLAVGLALLSVVVTLDWMGLRVGTGNLAMPTVAAWGTLVASLAGGATMGLVLARHVVRTAPANKAETAIAHVAQQTVKRSRLWPM